MLNRSQQHSPYSDSTPGDPKPRAAFRLGFGSGSLSWCDTFDDFEETVRTLSPEMLPNPYSELQSLLSVSPEFQERFQRSPIPHGGWDLWQPVRRLMEHLRTVADNALPASGRYRKWYDVGRLLGEWLRQLRAGGDHHLDVRELRHAIRLLPADHLERLGFLHQFLKLSVGGAEGVSGLESVLRTAVSRKTPVKSDSQTNCPEPASAAKPDETDSNIVVHRIVVSSLHEAVVSFTERIEGELRVLAQLPGPATANTKQLREARDEWIYQQCMAGTVYSHIIDKLTENAVGWEPITTPNGVKRAAIGHADKHGLPPPLPRSPGRPKKSEHDR